MVWTSPLERSYARNLCVCGCVLPFTSHICFQSSNQSSAGRVTGYRIPVSTCSVQLCVPIMTNPKVMFDTCLTAPLRNCIATCYHQWFLSYTDYFWDAFTPKNVFPYNFRGARTDTSAEMATLATVPYRCQSLNYAICQLSPQNIYTVGALLRL